MVVRTGTARVLTERSEGEARRRAVFARQIGSGLDMKRRIVTICFYMAKRMT